MLWTFKYEILKAAAGFDFMLYVPERAKQKIHGEGKRFSIWSRTYN